MPTGSLRGHRRVAVGVFAAVVAVSAYAGAVGLVTGGVAIGAGADQLPLGPLPGGVTLAVAAARRRRGRRGWPGGVIPARMLRR